MREFPELDESTKAGHEREAEQRDLGSREDPEHLHGEFGIVLKEEVIIIVTRYAHLSLVIALHIYLHDEEYDEDDDAANEAQEAEEETLARALAVHAPVTSLLQKSQ